MNKKAQISLEFIIIIGFVLIITLFFANSVFGTTDINKALAKVKLRTLDIFSMKGSIAQLEKIDYFVNDTNLQLNLYVNKNFDDFNLTLEDYSSTLENLENSTSFTDVNLAFIYINE
ncbi:MAG TPA: class III signal peptide-containing protein [archaeon]|jgi:hypothetical protein|nr:class III signal peptide-containing protein [archaeon]